MTGIKELREAGASEAFFEGIMKKLALTACFIATSTLALAQSLTPAEIAALVDQRVDTLDPYQELLNDPDPERSLAALQIMMESGDLTLTRMAMEFGVLASNPTVQRAALEAFFATLPILTFRFDGSGVKDTDFPDRIRRYGGNLGADGIGFARFPVGDFDNEQGCYVHRGFTNCFVTTNADGVFINGSTISARLKLDGEGQLIGSATLQSVTESVPVAVRLID
ncbi:MAG: hypothetical protein AAF066_05120 [Pseudomonadota bacterium]